MAGSGKKQLENKVTKKEARKVVYEKLAGALAEFKGTVSEKKFRNKLKKASKLFAVDIAKASRSSKQIPKASTEKEVLTAH
jgi:hypothetical protein